MLKHLTQKNTIIGTIDGQLKVDGNGIVSGLTPEKEVLYGEKYSYFSYILEEVTLAPKETKVPKESSVVSSKDDKLKDNEVTHKKTTEAKTASKTPSKATTAKKATTNKKTPAKKAVAKKTTKK